VPPDCQIQEFVWIESLTNTRAVSAEVSGGAQQARDRLPFTETFEFDPTERKFSVELASGTTAYAVYLRPTLDARSSTRRAGVWLLSRLGLSRCGKLEDRKFAESAWKHTYAETA
jgi:hypothetical protein